jgi:hypothetical protein
MPTAMEGLLARDSWEAFSFALHANNGRVRPCNMDKVSVVGERAAPRCSKWAVD